MAVLTQDDLLEAIDKMTVLELSEFIKRFEERYGVTAAAPVAVAAAPAAGGGDAGAGAAAGGAEEQSEFSAVLSEVGPNKIPVIKVVRELTGLGLKEAKDLVDNAPKPVKEKISKSEAADMKKKLEEVGAAARRRRTSSTRRPSRSRRASPRTRPRRSRVRWRSRAQRSRSSSSAPALRGGRVAHPCVALPARPHRRRRRRSA